MKKLLILIISLASAISYSQSIKISQMPVSKTTNDSIKFLTNKRGASRDSTMYAITWKPYFAGAGLVDTIGGAGAKPALVTLKYINNTYAGTTNITTLGNIGAGAWAANVINATYGGTGRNNGANTLSWGSTMAFAANGSGVATNDGGGNISWASGAAPIGAAGGDLSGFYPNPTVVKVNGNLFPGNPLTGSYLYNNGSGAMSWKAPNITSYEKFNPATGSTISSTGKEILIADPMGTLAALTINFPLSPNDGQEFNVAVTQIITVLTLNGSGNTVNGTIATSAVNSYGKWVFVSGASTWYKID